MITYSQLGKNGRLGNQLFQISSTIGIATYNDTPYYFPRWEYSEYFKDEIPQGEMSYIYDRMSHVSEYEEKGFEFEMPHLDTRFDWNLTGYFQSYKYFEHCKDLILDYFTPKDKFPNTKECSIHIRRGDYLSKSNFHTNLDMKYYRKAMSLFDQDTKFTVFSDDLEWCFFDADFGKFKERVEFHVNCSDIDDLFYMSRCQHHVLANSSYSWWASYLDQKGGITVAPKEWFQVNLNTKDLYLPNWILI